MGVGLTHLHEHLLERVELGPFLIHVVLVDLQAGLCECRSGEVAAVNNKIRRICED